MTRDLPVSPAPGQPVKGAANGLCNRTACQAPLADEPTHQFMEGIFTGGPRLHYCEHCAADFDKWDYQSGDAVRIAREEKSPDLPVSPQPDCICTTKGGPEGCGLCNETGRGGGWIPWSGGFNPAPGQRVDVRLRNGAEYTDPSDSWEWSHTHPLVDEDDQIVAFRVLSAEAHADPLATPKAEDAASLARKEAILELLGNTYFGKFRDHDGEAATLFNLMSDEEIDNFAETLARLVSAEPDRAEGGETEAVAKLVYEAMTWAAQNAETGKVPAWVDGGNSFAQDCARGLVPRIKAALSSSPSQEQAGAVETGWLVEQIDGRGPLYRQASGLTRAASEALRFARQADAEAFIATYEGGQYVSVTAPKWSATAHRWG